MGENSKIEWCDHTFNPWYGCTKVSPACDHCYAEAWAKRSALVQWGNHPRRRTSESYWRQPAKWNLEASRTGIRKRVFCASLADVFDNQADPAWRCDLWHLIRGTPYLDWLLLTKRPQNLAKMLPRQAEGALLDWGDGWPNVWLGTTAEDDHHYRQRWHHLAAAPARIRFLSYEPALGPIGDLGLGRVGAPEWIICGGESGPGARPAHPDWFRSFRDQCVAGGVPFFFKQHGEFREFDTGSPEVEIIDNDSQTAQFVVECAIRPSWIAADGRHFTDRRDLPVDVPCRLIERLGKRRAGALLDGREWREMP